MRLISSKKAQLSMGVIVGMIILLSVSGFFIVTQTETGAGIKDAFDNLLEGGEYREYDPAKDCPARCLDEWLGNDVCDVYCNNLNCNYDDGDCTDTYDVYNPTVCEGQVLNNYGFEDGTSIDPENHNLPEITKEDYCKDTGVWKVTNLAFHSGHSVHATGGGKDACISALALWDMSDALRSANIKVSFWANFNLAGGTEVNSENTNLYCVVDSVGYPIFSFPGTEESNSKDWEYPIAGEPIDYADVLAGEEAKYYKWIYFEQDIPKVCLENEDLNLFFRYITDSGSSDSYVYIDDIKIIAWPPMECYCDNGKDDDGDKDIDCGDSDCTDELYCKPPVYESECDDGIDNDDNKLIDCDDPFCDNLMGPDGFNCEFIAEDTCDDGFDNNYNGAIDCEDTTCCRNAICDGLISEYGKCEYSKEISCDNEFDNDRDQYTDCADDDCFEQCNSCGDNYGYEEVKDIYYITGTNSVAKDECVLCKGNNFDYEEPYCYSNYIGWTVSPGSHDIHCLWTDRIAADSSTECSEELDLINEYTFDSDPTEASEDEYNDDHYLDLSTYGFNKIREIEISTIGFNKIYKPLQYNEEYICEADDADWNIAWIDERGEYYGYDLSKGSLNIDTTVFNLDSCVYTQPLKYVEYSSSSLLINFQAKFTLEGRDYDNVFLYCAPSLTADLEYIGIITNSDICESGNCRESEKVPGALNHWIKVRYDLPSSCVAEDMILLFRAKTDKAIKFKDVYIDNIQIYEAPEAICYDALDNDNDGLTDCEDNDCFLRSCGSGCECKSSEKHETSCDDDIDNDADGKIDCADHDCISFGSCGNERKGYGFNCQDMFDNDNDGTIDCADSGCAGYYVMCQHAPEGKCASGDDDGFFCQYGKERYCSDQEDNDADGKIDCDDTDCEDDCQ